MSKYKLIIFDLDDTLFDYSTTEYDAIMKTCLKFNIKFNDDVYALYKKANMIAKQEVHNCIMNLDIFREKRVGIFLDMLKEYNIRVVDFINEYLLESECGILIDGVVETLQAIEPTIRKVVGTNGSTYPRKNKLMNSPISKYIDSFYSSEMLGVAKPDPTFFIKICNDQGVDIKETLVVGDSFKNDIQGAYRAGIDSCLITTSTYNLPENSRSISSIRNLIGVIS